MKIEPGGDLTLEFPDLAHDHKTMNQVWVTSPERWSDHYKPSFSDFSAYAQIAAIYADQAFFNVKFRHRGQETLVQVQKADAVAHSRHFV